MVKIISFFSVFSCCLNLNAAFLLGVSTQSWQEKIPIIVSSVQSDHLTSFSSYGFNLGYDYLYSTRIRYTISASYSVGKADIHKLDNAISPRRNFNSTWLTNKVAWRMTKTFSLGPSLVLNSRKIDNLDVALNTGLFLDLDFDFQGDTRLTQSLGTMSDSQQLAYSFVLTHIF